MTEQNKKDCIRIASYYGYESQSRQLIEEMAELMQAINKHWRSFFARDTEAKMIEEIADVEICIEQIKYILQCADAVDRVQEIKIERQFKRIKNEYGE